MVTPLPKGSPSTTHPSSGVTFSANAFGAELRRRNSAPEMPGPDAPASPTTTYSSVLGRTAFAQTVPARSKKVPIQPFVDAAASGSTSIVSQAYSVPLTLLQVPTA